MTALTRPVRRSVTAPRSGNLVVEITAEGLRLREKGRRTWFGPAPWGALYVALARMEADARRAAKAAEKAAKAASRPARRRR